MTRSFWSSVVTVVTDVRGVADVRACWLLTVLSCLLVSCGVEGDRFRLEGRLRNMNQGEFWVYSPDGGINGIDTIKVRDGRFAYEKPLHDPATLIIIFPNYSEQPVFAQPGAKVTIKGDASHLKEITIKGTSDNEKMTALRHQLNELMPPDVPKKVASYIRENAESPVSVYLLLRYLVNTPSPDYKEARALTQLLMKQQRDNGQLIHLSKQLPQVTGGQTGTLLPKFAATDIKGNKVTEAALKGRVAVVTAWASWNYQSTDIQRRLKKLKDKHGDKLGVVSICLEGRPAECKRIVDRDSLKWSTVCDGKMWQTPLLATFGMANVPDNIVTDEKGLIVARSLSSEKLEERINKLLSK